VKDFRRRRLAIAAPASWYPIVDRTLPGRDHTVAVSKPGGDHFDVITYEGMFLEFKSVHGSKARDNVCEADSNQGHRRLALG
jgi:hypothetical protein